MLGRKTEGSRHTQSSQPYASARTDKAERKVALVCLPFDHSQSVSTRSTRSIQQRCFPTILHDQIMTSKALTRNAFLDPEEHVHQVTRLDESKVKKVNVYEAVAGTQSFQIVVRTILTVHRENQWSRIYTKTTRLRFYKRHSFILNHSNSTTRCFVQKIECPVTIRRIRCLFCQ